jgi:hypothetical protein
LPEQVQVAAAQEVGLHVQLPEEQVAAGDAGTYPAVRGVEAPGVPDHADQSALALRGGGTLCVGPAVGQRDLDLHVLARAQHGNGLFGVQRGRGAQDDRVDVVMVQDLGQVGCRELHAVLGGDLPGLVQAAADDGGGGDAGVVDGGERVEVFAAERAGPGQGNPQRRARRGCHAARRTRWPTAVLEAGTW